MVFNSLMGIIEIPKNSKVFYREAVRAVIFSDKNKLLLIHNSNGDYKFPGGGVEDGERHIETLKREVLEEIGVIIRDNTELLGIIRQQSIDKKEPDAYFVMQSVYYQCFIDKYTDSVRLDEYEKKLSFQLKEINLFEAYKHNLTIFTQGETKSVWLERELLALEYLTQYFIEGSFTKV